MTELLFCMMLCAITVQWSFTALRRGREGERDKDRQRERESMCVCKKSGTGASSPHPYCCCLQSEECCISWGQCRGQGRGGSLQLRSPYRKHRAGLQTQRACGRRRNWEGQRRREGGRWTDREKDRETDELQHSAWCLFYPMFSTKKIQLHAIRGQKWEWIIFTPQKLRPRISVSLLDCPLTVLWLDVFVCSLFQGNCPRQPQVFNIKRPLHY